MKWFPIQSFFLAIAAFGLGALFHRLLWKKRAGVGSSSTGPVSRFADSAEVQDHKVNGDATIAWTAELAALRDQHDKVLAERDAKVKEFAALFFEHSAMKTALIHRDKSIASLRSELDAAATSTSAASNATQDLLSQVERHQATIDEFRNQLASSDADAAALAALRTDHDGRLATLTSEHDGALDELRVDCEGHLATQSTDHHAALTALRLEHDRALQEAHGDRDRTLSGLRSDHEKSLAELRRRAESAEDALARLTSEHEGSSASLSRLREELGSEHVDPAGAGIDVQVGSGAIPSVAAVAADPGSDDAFEGDDVSADDLLRIEGIGPKISEILTSGGVRTFRRLAAMPEERVRSIVNAGGVSFVPTLGTWAGQAALLRDGDEAGFQAFVERLVAGRDDSR